MGTAIPTGPQGVEDKAEALSTELCVEGEAGVCPLGWSPSITEKTPHNFSSSEMLGPAVYNMGAGWFLHLRERLCVP